MNIPYKFLQKYMFSVLLGVYLRMERLSRLVQFCRLCTAQPRGSAHTVATSCVTYKAALFEVDLTETEIDLFCLLQKLELIVITDLNGPWLLFFLNERYLRKDMLLKELLVVRSK